MRGKRLLDALIDKLEKSDWIEIEEEEVNAQECLITEELNIEIDKKLKGRYSPAMDILCLDGVCYMSSDIPINSSNRDVINRLEETVDRYGCKIDDVHEHGEYNHYHVKCIGLKEGEMNELLFKLVEIIGEDVNASMRREE